MMIPQRTGMLNRSGKRHGLLGFRLNNDDSNNDDNDDSNNDNDYSNNDNDDNNTFKIIRA